MKKPIKVWRVTSVTTCATDKEKHTTVRLECMTHPEEKDKITKLDGIRTAELDDLILVTEDANVFEIDKNRLERKTLYDDLFFKED